MMEAKAGFRRLKEHCSLPRHGRRLPNLRRSRLPELRSTVRMRSLPAGTSRSCSVQ
jgi:hypothetical protein